MDQPADVISEIVKYQGVIFDLDGTLVDLGVDWAQLKKGLAQYLYKQGSIVIEFIPLDQKLFENKSKLGNKLHQELLDIVAGFELIEENYKLNEKLISYINSEMTASKKMAIYSMNTKKCINNIVKKYLKREPDIIISKETCLEPKPTDKDIARILQHFGLDNKNVLFVGDSERDLISGKMANVCTYLVKI